MNEQEKIFFEYIANKYRIFGEERRVFLERFDPKNAESSNSDVARALGKDLQEFQDCLGRITDKFDFKAQGKGRPKKGESPWQKTYPYLWNEQYLEFCGIKIFPEAPQNETIPRQVFTEMLNHQIELLTTNPITAGDEITFKQIDISVLLGLRERKKQERVKEDYRELGLKFKFPTSEYEITCEFENDEFFTEVLEQGKSPKSQGRRIAIIGEPGAGKTTLLQQIVDRVSEKHPKDIIIWVSLADLKGEDLEDYLLDKWLKIALRDFEVKPESKQALVEIFKTENVWLLLDGLDEMGISNPLFWVHNQIKQGWISSARIVLTCRLNVWDVGKNYLESFDVYRNLDFTKEQVQDFINKFFINQSERSVYLQTELNKAGKERIRDLIKNPLRLTLLCYTWQRWPEGALPETKAGLYKWFVKTFYKWKDQYKHLNVDSVQQTTLNKALGELAKEALDQPSSRFRLTHSQIVQFLGETDEPLCKLALDLGWLNRIGVAEENPNEEVYAFFHASFQEYFAALAIDDYKFFLNHVPENPDKGTYRVFEPQWKEVILLWFGIDQYQISKTQKEKLLDELISLDENKTIFIYTKSFLLASEAMGEFKYYNNENAIVEQLIEWSYGDCFEPLSTQSKQILDRCLKNNPIYTNHLCLLNEQRERFNFAKYFATQKEQDPKQVSSEFFVDKSNETFKILLKLLPLWGLGIKIDLNHLNNLNDLNDLDKIQKIRVIDFEWIGIKWKIKEATDHQLLINIFSSSFLLSKNSSDNLFNQESKNTFKEIYSLIENVKLNQYIPLNPLKAEIISTAYFRLKELFFDENSKSKQEIIVRDLIKGFNNNIDTISVRYFMRFLSETTVDHENSSMAIIETMENLETINDEIKSSILEEACSSLINILKVDIFLMQKVVMRLQKYLLDDDLNCSEYLFFFSRDILWHCCQNMIYPEFYKAWHGQTENTIPESLQQQNLDLILENLKTNNPYLRTINIKILNEETGIHRLAKGIINRIFINPIFPINDIYDLERHIKTEIPNLALILHGENPSNTLIQLCQHLSEFARIAIITNQPIEPPLRGFSPDQPTLENTLRSWLEETEG